MASPMNDKEEVNSPLRKKNSSFADKIEQPEPDTIEPENAPK